MRGGVRGRLVFMLVSLSESICGPGRRGVAFPESLSVDILSLSLSESSPIPLELCLRVKEDIRGLWRRLSCAAGAPCGPNILGRLSRNKNGLRSSEADGGSEAEGDDGKANSEDEVGREGREIDIVSRSGRLFIAVLLEVRYWVDYVSSRMYTHR